MSDEPEGDESMRDGVWILPRRVRGNGFPGAA